MEDQRWKIGQGFVLKCDAGSAQSRIRFGCQIRFRTISRTGRIDATYWESFQLHDLNKI